MTTICFFIDISPRVGTGHFWRSFRLAEALQKQGPDVVCFLPENVVATSALQTFSDQHPLMPSYRLIDAPDSTFDDPFSPLAQNVVAPILGNHSLYVIDSYRVSRESLAALKSEGRSPVVVLDEYDHRDFHSGDIDAILNPGIPADTLPYNGIRCFSPPDFHLLSEDFFAPSVERRNNLIITFGGTDKGQIGLRLLDEMLDRFPCVDDGKRTYDVTVSAAEGGMLHDPARLKRRLKDRLRIVTRYHAVDFFRGAGCIVCSGSQSAFEAQASGVPFAGIGVLNISQKWVGCMAETHGIAVQNLEGFHENRGNPSDLAAFAERLAPIIADERTQRLPRQSPDGRKKLIAALLDLSVKASAHPA